MCSYLIVGIEFAFLYLVFWYVFIRESKDYKVNRPIWGVYENHAEELNKADDSVVLLFSNRYDHGVSVRENKLANVSPRKSA